MDATGNSILSAARIREKRIALVVTNTHPTAFLYMSLGAPAVVGRGIPVYPGGGVQIIDYFDLAVYAVHDSTGTINFPYAEV